MAVQKQILRLEVAMDDFALVTVVDGRHDLAHDHGCVLLVEVFDFLDAVEELAPREEPR